MTMNIKTSYANVPQWKSVTVKSKMPKALQKLDELANNMCRYVVHAQL